MEKENEVSAASGGSVDLFELIVAIVLGLGALGGAWASFQSGLWGGNQATAYGEAANMMAQAAAVASEAGTDSTEASQTANRDADLDVQITRLLWEAEKQHARAMAKAKSPEDKESADDELTDQKDLAKYLYASQMSEEALKYLGLEGKDDPEKISDAELKAASEKSIGEEYYKELYAPSEAKYEESRKIQADAKKKFAEGMMCNYKGDLLSFTGVLYTVCLFLAGIALVFKSKVRWVFGGLSVVMLLSSTAHLVSNEWTKSDPPNLTAAADTADQPAKPAATAKATTSATTKASSAPSATAAASAAAAPSAAASAAPSAKATAEPEADDADDE